VGFGFSPNTGNLLENLVFFALRRQTHEIYYCATPGGYEMDFYLPENRQLIQVAHNLDASRTATREREVRALSDALTGVKVESALILSDANENSFELGGVRVEVRSVGEWLLSQ
jgi:predicted AAA+ superfamily ATPase